MRRTYKNFPLLTEDEDLPTLKIVWRGEPTWLAPICTGKRPDPLNGEKVVVMLLELGVKAPKPTRQGDKDGSPEEEI